MLDFLTGGLIGSSTPDKATIDQQYRVVNAYAQAMFKGAGIRVLNPGLTRQTLPDQASPILAASNGKSCNLIFNNAPESAAQWARFSTEGRFVPSADAALTAILHEVGHCYLRQLIVSGQSLPRLPVYRNGVLYSITPDPQKVRNQGIAALLSNQHYDETFSDVFAVQYARVHMGSHAPGIIQHLLRLRGTMKDDPLVAERIGLIRRYAQAPLPTKPSASIERREVIDPVAIPHAVLAPGEASEEAFQPLD